MGYNADAGVHKPFACGVVVQEQHYHHTARDRNRNVSDHRTTNET